MKERKGVFLQSNYLTNAAAAGRYKTVFNFKFGVVESTWLAPEAAHFSKGCMCVKANTLLSLDFARSG
jgi:hypothetical protein